MTFSKNNMCLIHFNKDLRSQTPAALGLERPLRLPPTGNKSSAVDATRAGVTRAVAVGADMALPTLSFFFPGLADATTPGALNENREPKAASL